MRFCENYCVEDISLVENYELAKAENFKGWAVHHKLEAFYCSKDLKKMKLYFMRPARELIFLRQKGNDKYSHFYWPQTGMGRDKGCVTWSKGKKLAYVSELNRKRNSTDVMHNPEVIAKMAKTISTLKWYNNGIKNVRRVDCPEGFVPGRLTPWQRKQIE